jgi:carbamoyl-phosphate synthase large subunit
MITVLLSGGGGAGSEALVRLWSEKYHLHLADADPDALPPSTPIAQRHQIALAGKNWASSVAEVCQKIQAKVFIPTVDEELLLLPELRPLLPELQILAPSDSFIKIMNDKLLFSKALYEKNISTPKTYLIGEGASLGFPCLAKPRFGRGSRGIQQLQNAEELHAYLCLAHQAKDQLLVQDLLSGQEWTVYVSADAQGNLQSVVPICVEKKKGITIRAHTEQHAGIAALCERFHAVFRTAGPYNIQLFETQNGELVIFEVNPRVSTTLCLAVSAGADPIADYLSSGTNSKLAPFQSGIRLQRNWFNHISVPRE